jgi:hypothetical protein
MHSGDGIAAEERTLRASTTLIRSEEVLPQRTKSSQPGTLNRPSFQVFLLMVLSFRNSYVPLRLVRHNFVFFHCARRDNAIARSGLF